MGVIGKTVEAGVDYFTYPLSYTVKAFSGKTIGDYVTGNDRPPSQNGLLGGTMSFATDILAPGVVTAIAPPLGAVAVAGAVGLKALTGNSVGDYVTGNTDAKRQEAENQRIDQEYEIGHQRAREREAMASQPSQQQMVSAPNVGMQRGQEQAQQAR